MTTQENFRSSYYSIITIFFILVVIGIAIIPLNQFKLKPNNQKPQLTVHYYLHNTSAAVIDSEITTKLEGLFNTIEAITNLKSESGHGYGKIVLKIEKTASIDQTRFYISSLIRQIYPDLPAGTTYPYINTFDPEQNNDSKHLLSYTLTGPDARWIVGQFAENDIKSSLLNIAGVHSINVHGFTPVQWQLTYDKSVLQQLSITPQDISRQVRQYYTSLNLGNCSLTIDENHSSMPIRLESYALKEIIWDKIYIKCPTNLIKLTNLVTVTKVESAPHYYYRINGLNTISINISAKTNINEIKLANNIRKTLSTFKLPDNYSLILNYDSTKFLKTELHKIVVRILSSIVLLLLFTFLINKNIRYLLILNVSLIVIVIISFIGFYLFSIELHIYSLAGITISFGIVIDNTIVLIEHAKTNKNLTVIRAIVAATLTTMASLVVVFYLDEQEQLILTDFVYVIIILLTVSIITSIFFIPALLHYWPISNSTKKNCLIIKRRYVFIYNIYKRIILFTKRFKVIIFSLMLFAFGVPSYLLPESLSNNNYFSDFYNNSLGSQSYVNHIKPVVDKILGGSLRLFFQETTTNSGNSVNQTCITINGTMHDGTTIQMTNEIIKKIENLITKHEEVEQFETSIYGSKNANVSLTIKPEHEYNGFPTKLKNILQQKVIEMGAGDWKIHGVGRGFDNSLNLGHKNTTITFYGYNYEKLNFYTNKFKKDLKLIQRVDQNSIFVNGTATYNGQLHKEKIISLNKNKLDLNNLHSGFILSGLQNLSNQPIHVINLYSNSTQPVMIKPDRTTIPDFWKFRNSALPLDSLNFVRLNQFGDVKTQRIRNLIHKENMEYTMVVEFDFIGSIGQKTYILGQVVKKAADNLPIGYRLKSTNSYLGWNNEKTQHKKIVAILIIGLLLFGLSALIFESLKQPLIIISMIPLSLIGVFVTFYFTDIGLNSGAFASMIFLSGITVNSAIYIINDLNIIRKHKKIKYTTKTFIKAMQRKIVPISLTIISTIIGLLPFLFTGRKDMFWFSISVGIIGGLFFSFFVLIFILPLLINTKEDV